MTNTILKVYEDAARSYSNDWRGGRRPTNYGWMSSRTTGPGLCFKEELVRVEWLELKNNEREREREKGRELCRIISKLFFSSQLQT